MQTTVSANLTVIGKGRTRKIPLDPDGAVIGRHPDCEVVLGSGRVSRKHARIFLDPFGRWVVEDLGSRNGVWIRDRRAEIAAVGPGEKITIGPFSLVVDQELAEPIEPETSSQTTSLLVEGGRGELLTAVDRPPQPVPQARMKQLNDIIDALGGLASPAELYPAICESLTETPSSVALVVRVPVRTEPLPLSPRMLTCRFGPGHRGRRDAGSLHVSRRVLEAVRATNSAVMASNVDSSEAQLGLTVVDDLKPRAVYASCVAEMPEAIDVLYLDIPCDAAMEETFDFVRVVARQVSATRKSLLLAQARAERIVLDRQLEMARGIQSGLTPAGLTRVPGVDIAVRYQPAMWVGGDYCDVWTLGDGRVAIAVGDVAGKGLPAAMVMTNLQAALRATMSFCCQPSEVMGRLNSLLEQNLPEGMFVTFFLGLFDPVTGRLEYVNAGHLLPLKIVTPGEASALGRPANVPLGILAESASGEFSAEAVILPEGGGLVVFTDGITEAASPDGRMLGVEPLHGMLVRHGGFDSAGQLADCVVAAAVSFRQTLPQQDDITVLALIRNGNGGDPPPG